MRFDEYRQFDATGLAELVRAREVRPRELVAAAAAGLARYNPGINAITQDWSEYHQENPPPDAVAGRLGGVPYLIKDMLEWQGRRVTFGSRLLARNVARYTHPLTERYLDAGLVPLGVTNMSELGLLPLTEPAAYGPTRNPWALERSPGGSSGGSAAAVACGITPAAHAADGGGSIRIPAAACGLFGIKPTRGRVVEGPLEVPDGFVTHHCISRSVRDSALLLEIGSGPSPASRWPCPNPDESFMAAAERPPRPLRIGVMLEDFRGRDIAPACRRAVEDAASLCEDLGHRVEPARPSLDGEAYLHAFGDLWSVGAGFFFRLVRAELRAVAKLPRPIERLVEKPGSIEASVRAAAALGFPVVEPLTLRSARRAQTVRAHDLWVAWQVLNRATASMFEFFQRYDLLLTATLAEPPWRIGQWRSDGKSLEACKEELFTYAGLTPVANTAGLPAMSVPLSWADGLPIGTQFLGPYAAEATLLSLAAQLEQARPWAQRFPELPAGD